VYVGGTDSSIIFESGSIPYDFTICSLSRYSGTVQHKIMTKFNDGENWFHGHADGIVGVAYYDVWKTSPLGAIAPHSKTTDWLVGLHPPSAPLISFLSQQMRRSLTVVMPRT